MNSLTNRLQVLVFLLVAPSLSLVVRAQAPPPTPRPVDDRVISEIEQIRSRMGDGVAERLSGLISEEDAEREFRDELRRQSVQGDGSLPVRRQSGFGSDQEDRGQSQPQLSQPQLSPSRGVPGFHERPLTIAVPFRSPEGLHERSHGGTEAHHAVHQLRQAARRLDELSAGFEEVGLFDEADQLRAQAAKFWLKARSPRETSKKVTRAAVEGELRLARPRASSGQRSVGTRIRWGGEESTAPVRKK